MKQSISYNLNNIVQKTGLKKYAVAEKCGYSAKDLVTFCVAENE